jgi:hypothetical protein
MTAKETIDIIRESSLWESLTLREKTEAIAYAIEAVGCAMNSSVENDVSDILKEIASKVSPSNNA